MILEEKFREWLRDRRVDLIKSRESEPSVIYRHITLGRIHMIEEIQELLEFNPKQEQSDDL